MFNLPKKEKLFKNMNAFELKRFGLEGLYNLAKKGNKSALKQFMEEYKLRIYTNEQIEKLNKGLEIIKEVMENK